MPLSVSLIIYTQLSDALHSNCTLNSTRWELTFIRHLHTNICLLQHRVLDTATFRNFRWPTLYEEVLLICQAFTTSSISRKMTPTLNDSSYFQLPQFWISSVFIIYCFCFFRSELKMAVPDVKFTTKECRAVTKQLFLKGKRSEENHGDLSLTSGEVLPTRQLKTGMLDLRQEFQHWW